MTDITSKIQKFKNKNKKCRSICQSNKKIQWDPYVGGSHHFLYLTSSSNGESAVTMKALRQRQREVAGKEGVTTFRGGRGEDGDEGANELELAIPSTVR